MKVLLFGGTAEGRILAGKLAASAHAVTCSVATEYGRELIAKEPGLTVLTGRLNEKEMEQLIRAKRFNLVIDATHPYAAEVSRNIRSSADAAGVQCVRLFRPTQSTEGVEWVKSPQEAAKYLSVHGCTALLTTGSKDLSVFTAVPNYRDRLWVRILPSVASLQTALDAGFPASHIICMQGPFTAELNAAMLRQTGAEFLVSKDSGKEGGFAEKAEAARRAGAGMLVIRRPMDETGLSLAELMEMLCPGDLKREVGV